MSAGAGAEGFDHPGPPRGAPEYSVDDWQPVVDSITRARDPDGLEAERSHAGVLPPLDLPGFGEPEDDCGEYIPQAMRFCTECGDVKEVRHNCLRYDCPDHAPYAIRRRVAGSSSGSGVAPRLDALRRYLNAYRNDNQHFQHLVISPPRDFVFKSERPLEAGKEIVAEILELLGVQGAVAFHGWSGDNEELEDDRGKWRTRLFHGREWDGDVRDELEHRPHFHVIGVAPFVDLSEVGQLYDATGWVVHRITRSEGSNVSIGDDAGMARAVTYALSHAGIYETAEQRRLAAWFKGPDVNRVRVLEQHKDRIAAIVNEVAEDTLGIPSPSPYCDNDRPDFIRESELRRRAGGPLAVEPLGGFAGPDVATRGTPDVPTTTGSASSAASSWSSTTGSSSSSSSTSSSSGGGGLAYDHGTTPDVVECGGYCRHISKAGKYLTDPERRHQLVYVDDLEAAYRSYVDVMTAEGLEPDDDPRPELPEERDPPDRPPPG